MPARKTATGTSTAGRSRVTAALRKATSVVAKAAGHGSSSATGGTVKKATSAKQAGAKKSPAKTTAAAKKTSAAKTTKKATAAKKRTAKTSAAKTSAAKKQAAKKPTGTTTAAAKKTTAKTSAAKESAKRAAAGNTAVAKAAAVKKSPAKKAGATVSKATAKQAVATRATKAKASAKKAAPAKKATPTKKAAVKKVTPTKPTAPANARKLKVRDDESPWTAKELAAVRAELQADVERLTHELSGFEDDIAGLIKDSGDGAGDDQADTGAKTFEREHEASLAQNSRDLLEQSVHALQRIDDGTYGVCENCGNAIGKLRLQAFPRATLCLTCKAQQERR